MPGVNVIDFAAARAAYLADAGGANIVYMNYGDDLFSGYGADTIACGGGNNAVQAAGGSFLAFGGQGLLHFSATGGSHTVIGGALGLQADGGDGRLVAFGQAGATTLTGGLAAGNVLVGGSGTSLLQGVAANDLLVAAGAISTLTASGPRATLFGGAFGYTVMNTQGFTDSAHPDIVVASTGAEEVYAAVATDIFAGPGRDIFHIAPFGAGILDVIVNYNVLNDTIWNDVPAQTGGMPTVLQPSFTNGVFYTALANGSHLAVFAAPG